MKKLLLAPLALSSAMGMSIAQDSEQWDITTSSWILFETGGDAESLSFPELVVRGEKSNLHFTFFGDLLPEHDADIGGSYEPRVLAANIQHVTSDHTVTLGMLTPFHNRITGADFINNIPTPYVSDLYVVQGGITGARYDRHISLSDTRTLTLGGFAGTKIDDFSEFGNSDGPGFGALIYGGGFDLKQQFGPNTFLKTGYNVSHFGEGPAGQSQTDHYGYGVLTHAFGRHTIKAIGEVNHSLTRNQTNPETAANDTHYIVTGQYISQISDRFTVYSSGSYANDVPIIDTGVIKSFGQEKRTSVQLAGGAKFEDDGTDVVANMTFFLKF